MKILFMGTPDIAAVALGALYSEGFEIVGVVTQPDKPRGRKQILTPPETKVRAEELGLKVYQPQSLKNGELMHVLEELNPDVIAVVAYGKILPKYVLEFPKYGCINMHASLLPKYRGASPIQQAVINGDEITGVTTMKMDEGLDTGDILLVKTIEIGEYETSGELFGRMSELGAKTLIETFNNIENITPVPQPEEGESYASIITKEMAEIDWNCEVKKISKLICGMNPWPVAYTHYNNEVLKIFKGEILNEECEGVPGEVLEASIEKGIRVKCKDGTLIVREIQVPGGKRMKVQDYLRGHSINKGTIFQ